MDVIFKRTVSASLDELPIVDGQLIVLRDSDAMYYDMDGRRHPVVSALDGSFVTLDTEQIIPSNKQFTGTVTIVTLKQGTDCMASEGSVALGKETTALGQASVSSGHQTSASGDYSTASGNATTASGKGSHAAGAMTVAERNYSTVVGTGNDPQPEDMFEVGNGHVTNDDGEVLPEDQQTFSNAFRVTADGTAIAQKDFQLSDGTKLSGKESSSNKVTSIGSSPTDIQYPSAKAVKTYVDALPQPMIFKGSLGTGGTITALPSASADNEGYTYKVITPGTYSGQQADRGDTFISDGKSWILIPSGDEPSGTVTNVAAKGSNGIEVTGGPISTSGTLNISGKDVTDSSSGMMTPTMKKKLDTITESASAVTPSTKNGYVSIDGKDVKVYEHPGSGTNPHGTTKTDVGLGSVDNTADADKSVKYATSAGSAPANGGTATASNYVNVNNTENKRVSRLQYFQKSGDDTIMPTEDWYSLIRCQHPGYPNGYWQDIAFPFVGGGRPQVRQNVNGTKSAWKELAYKSDIPSSLPANGGNSSTVNGHTVKSDVPAGAKFTDTIYDDTALANRVTQNEKDVIYSSGSDPDPWVYDFGYVDSKISALSRLSKDPVKLITVVKDHNNALSGVAKVLQDLKDRLDSLIPIEEANL